MSKIGIFYGSSTGSTSEVAQRLAKALGAEANVYDVAGADAADAAAFDVLLLGSSRGVSVTFRTTGKTSSPSSLSRTSLARR